jgi:hypothetical protein
MRGNWTEGALIEIGLNEEKIIDCRLLDVDRKGGKIAVKKLRAYRLLFRRKEEMGGED